MDTLDIRMTLATDPNKETRLPVYDGIMLSMDSGDRLRVSRIINASISSGVRAGIGASG